MLDFRLNVQRVFKNFRKGYFVQLISKKDEKYYNIIGYGISFYTPLGRLRLYPRREFSQRLNRQIDHIFRECCLIRMSFTGHNHIQVASRFKHLFNNVDKWHDNFRQCVVRSVLELEKIKTILHLWNQLDRGEARKVFLKIWESIPDYELYHLCLYLKVSFTLASVKNKEDLIESLIGKVERQVTKELWEKQFS